ncbi:glycosyltransferase family 39 protein [Streptomyces anandii]|uniref:glycosyltransferase family 39 protein n=1 Tax=Streptomyces anandii TaxID=285454 RepID=UPI00379B10EE
MDVRPAHPGWLGPWTYLGAPFVLALCLGLWGLPRQGSIWDDEAMTYDAAHRSLPGLFSLLRHNDLVHGAYYLLMHAVFRVHDGLWALRIPSVLAIAVAASGVSLLGKRLAGPRAGLLAGLVFPLPPTVQWFEQDGRSYAIVAALVVWATLLLLRAVETGRTRTWAGYTVVTAASCVLHEFAVLALVAHGVTVLLCRVGGRALRAWAVSAGVVVVVLTPFATLSWRQADQISWISTPGWANLYDFPWLMAIGVVCSLVRPTPRERPRIVLWALAVPMLLLPTALLILATFTVKPVYVDRYVLYSVIGFALPTGVALDAIWRLAERRTRRWAWLTAGGAGAAVIIGTVLVPPLRGQHTPAARDNDLAAAARVVGHLDSPGDGVLFVPARLRLTAQLFPDRFAGVHDIALRNSARSSGTRYGVERSPKDIRLRITAGTRVIVLADDPPRGQPSDLLPSEQAKKAVGRAPFRVCTVRRVQGVRITVFARPGFC